MGNEPKPVTNSTTPPSSSGTVNGPMCRTRVFPDLCMMTCMFVWNSSSTWLTVPAQSNASLRSTHAQPLLVKNSHAAAMVAGEDAVIARTSSGVRYCP